jgi:MFS family permease
MNDGRDEPQPRLLATAPPAPTAPVTVEEPSPEAPRPEKRSANGSLVWGLALAQLVGWGTLYFAFALFVAPMEAELGWSRADLNGALTAGLLAAGLGSIPAGALVDRYGGRVLMTGGAVFGAVCLALWSQVETLPAFYLVWIGIGLATAASVQDLPFAVVTANVADYRRAITNVTLLAGLSSTVFLPLTSLLIADFGWRNALLALAAIHILGPGIISFVVLRGTVGSRTAEIVAPGVRDGSPMLAALRRPAFWGLALCFGTQSFAFTAVSFHGIPLLQERGVALGVIVAGLALIGPSQLVGRLGLLVVGPRISARTLGRIITPFLPVAMLLLLVVPPWGLPGLALFALVFGLGNGIVTIVRATGIAEILGTRGYGAVTGAMNMVLMVPRTAAPLAVAAAWELRGNYDGAIWMMVSLTAAGAVAFWLASMQRPG